MMLRIFILYALCNYCCWFWLSGCWKVSKVNHFSKNVIKSFFFRGTSQNVYNQRKIHMSQNRKSKEEIGMTLQSKNQLKQKSKEIVVLNDEKNINIYKKLNEEIANAGKFITGDSNFIIPKSCLLENNKMYRDFEFQTSIILFLENYVTEKKRNIRTAVVDYIRKHCFDYVEDMFLSDNGILNVKMNTSFLMKELGYFYKQYDPYMLNKKMKKGTLNKSAINEIYKGTVVVDFCSVNMGKHMHLGHLKSLFLGNAVSNVLTFLNYSVKKRSHIGDWNVNVALIITFLISFTDKNCLNSVNLSISKMNENKANETTSNMTNSAPIFFTNEKECETKKKKKDGQIENTEEMIKHYLNILKHSDTLKFYEQYEKLNVSHYKHMSVSTMETMYTISKSLYAKSDMFIQRTKFVLKKMYEMDKRVIDIWKIICNKTKMENDKICKSFEIKKLIDKGESFYIKFVPKILKELKKENSIIKINNKHCVLLKKRKGIDCNGNMNVLDNKTQYYDIVRINDEIKKQAEVLDNISLLKSKYDLLTLKHDAGYTYAAIDLATVYYRIRFEKANKIIYVVDENQRKHFMMVFSVADHLQLIPSSTNCVCINYGYILNERNKKIKTKDLCKTLYVKDVLQDCNLFNACVNYYAMNEKLKTADNLRKLKLSSMVYSYISVKNWKRQTLNTIFDKIPKDYIFLISSYNYISHLLGNWKNYDFSVLYKKYFNSFINHTIDLELKNVLLQILKFDFTILQVAENYNVEKMCSYLVNLSKKVWNFYQKECKQKHIQTAVKLIQKKHINTIFENMLNYISQQNKGNNGSNENCNTNTYSEENCKNIDENIMKKNHSCIHPLKYVSSNNKMFLTTQEKKKKKKKNDTITGNNIISYTSILGKKKMEEIQLHDVLHIITTIIILQSYLYIVSKVSHILNIKLIKFAK